MQEYLNDLNDKQREAVTSNKKRILVMAGAGSGKTKVLTTRIKYLLDKGVIPGDINAFTFTNKAAREMKWRLDSMLDDDLQSPSITTFHSYCYSFLREPFFYERLGFNRPPEVISDIDKSNIINEILKSYKENYSNIPFVKGISQIKNKTKITDINSSDLIIINTVYHEYQKRLLESSSIDFDDMIPLFIKLCDNPEIKELAQVKYVLVDECQDTNQIQYDLIKIISEKYQNVFFVGDEDQLIYSFRSSDISILKDFESRADEVIILNQNYRCNQDILNHANQLIDYNPDRLKKALYSNIKALNKVEFKEFNTQADEARMVAVKIKEFLDNGINPKAIAVLYRNNNQSFQIERELKALNINYTLFGGKPFFEYKEIKSIIYTYRLLFNPKNEIAFSLMYHQNTKIEAYEYKAFIDDYHNQNKDIITFASSYAIDSKIQNLGYNLLILEDLMTKIAPNDFFMELLKYLGYNKYIKESSKQKPEYQRIMALHEMISDLTLSDLKESFNQMILDNVAQNVNNTVSLLTIHKAKGLEFEIVFVVGLNEGILPGYKSKGKDLEEERRLAYVAMTRAKSHLYLYCSIIHFINGNIVKMKPSSFLVEAGINEAKVMEFFGCYWYNH